MGHPEYSEYLIAHMGCPKYSEYLTAHDRRLDKGPANMIFPASRRSGAKSPSFEQVTKEAPFSSCAHPV